MQWIFLGIHLEMITGHYPKQLQVFLDEPFAKTYRDALNEDSRIEKWREIQKRPPFRQENDIHGHIYSSFFWQEYF